MLVWNKEAAGVTGNVLLTSSECCSICDTGVLERTVSLIQIFFQLGKSITKTFKMLKVSIR
jgi:hypothetical protein